jgi:hypothetical protein
MSTVGLNLPRESGKKGALLDSPVVGGVVTHAVGSIYNMLIQRPAKYK